MRLLAYKLRCRHEAWAANTRFYWINFHLLLLLPSRPLIIHQFLCDMKVVFRLRAYSGRNLISRVGFAVPCTNAFSRRGTKNYSSRSLIESYSMRRTRRKTKSLIKHSNSARRHNKQTEKRVASVDAGAEDANSVLIAAFHYVRHTQATSEKVSSFHRMDNWPELGQQKAESPTKASGFKLFLAPNRQWGAEKKESCKLK
jgi:hypothetical protein